MQLNEILGEQNDQDVTVIDRPPVEKKKPADADVKPPGRYHVILHNDPYTPAEYVSELLSKEFGLPHDVAWQVMVKIHQEGQGIIATYPKDIAETKANKATSKANADGHPLLFTAEKE